MTRKAKVLGIALVALLSMSALIAQAAQAHSFTAVKGGETITGGPDAATGEKSDKFTLIELGAAVVCNKESFTGTTPGSPVGEQTIIPKYEECTDTLTGLPVSVKLNECDYVFHGATDANEHAAADVKCPTGKQIEVVLTAFGITIDIPAQNGLKGVHYTNITGANGKKAITNHATVEPIETTCTETSGTGVCEEILGLHPAVRYTGTEVLESPSGITVE